MRGAEQAWSLSPPVPRPSPGNADPPFELPWGRGKHEAPPGELGLKGPPRTSPPRFGRIPWSERSHGRRVRRGSAMPPTMLQESPGANFL